jgi:hypothetical protein
VRTPADAHALLPHLLEITDDVVEVRAELTEGAHADPGPPLADLKALEARLADLLDRIRELDVQLKGWAPLLVDIPVRVEGREVLFCWLEGDRELAWYHEVEHGFPGRRPLGHLER